MFIVPQKYSFFLICVRYMEKNLFLCTQKLEYVGR